MKKAIRVRNSSSVTYRLGTAVTQVLSTEGYSGCMPVIYHAVPSVILDVLLIPRFSVIYLRYNKEREKLTTQKPPKHLEILDAKLNKVAS